MFSIKAAHIGAASKEVSTSSSQLPSSNQLDLSLDKNIVNAREVSPW